MKLQELRDSRAAKLKAASDLLEKQTADGYVEKAEDNAAYDAIIKEIDAIDGKISRLLALEKLKGSAANPVADPAADPAITADPFKSKDGTVSFPQMRRYGKLKAFADNKTGEKDAYTAGMFIKATMFKDETAKLWCIENGYQANLKAQAEGVNTAGGFLVPTQFETAIIDLRETYGTFRSYVGVKPMGSDSLTIPRRQGGLQAYFVGENSQITESQKAWGQVQLSAKKIGCLARMSTELADDAVISIADDLAREMAYAFAILEDTVGWNGDGSQAHGGIQGVRTKIIDGTHTKSAVTLGHNTFATIDAADLAAVMAAIPKYAEKTAAWYCSQPAWALIFQRLIAASGGTSMMDLSGGKPARSYLGYPVIIDQTLPTVTTSQSGQAMFGFGDLSLATTFGERRGIRIKTSDERYFEYDQIGIQATERMDINIHDLGDNSAPGPFAMGIGS